VHDRIARCDGFRKPRRIDQLATVCEADKRGRAGHADAPYPQGAYQRAARDAAATVIAAPFVERGLDGPAIGEAMRTARIDAIMQVPKPDPPS
jgi:tRNA nucleotidyltransferase (CCA-adding enzyme)